MKRKYIEMEELVDVLDIQSDEINYYFDKRENTFIYLKWFNTLHTMCIFQ